MNIYRGCTHGCIYCDSRSECYQFTHPFEDVAVKQNAVQLLSDGCKRHGILLGVENVFSYLREFPEKDMQLGLFD